MAKLIIKPFEEKNHDIFYFDVYVFIYGVDVTDIVTGEITVTYTDREGHNTVTFTLNNYNSRLIITEEDFENVTKYNTLLIKKEPENVTLNLEFLNTSEDWRFSKRIKKEIWANKFSNIRQARYEDSENIDRVQYIYEFAKGSTIFHKNDPLVIFQHNPMTEEDEWMPLFTGFIDDSGTMTSDYLTGNSTVGMVGSCLRRLMKTMRVSSNPETRQYQEAVRGSISGTDKVPVAVFNKEGMREMFSDFLFNTQASDPVAQLAFENAMMLLIPGKLKVEGVGKPEKIVEVSADELASGMSSDILGGNKYKNSCVGLMTMGEYYLYPFLSDKDSLIVEEIKKVTTAIDIKNKQIEQKDKEINTADDAVTKVKNDLAKTREDLTQAKSNADSAAVIYANAARTGDRKLTSKYKNVVDKADKQVADLEIKRVELENKLNDTVKTSEDKKKAAKDEKTKLQEELVLLNKEYENLLTKYASYNSTFLDYWNKIIMFGKFKRPTDCLLKTLRKLKTGGSVATTELTNEELWENNTAPKGAPADAYKFIPGFYTEEQVKYIGKHSQPFDCFDPCKRQLHMLFPKAGTGTSSLTKFTYDSVSFNRTFTDRLSVIQEMCNALDYQFYVSPFGDCIVEFPFYDFEPEAFVLFQNYYKFDKHLITDDFVDEQGDVINTVVMTGGYACEHENRDSGAQGAEAPTAISCYPMLVKRMGFGVFEEHKATISATKDEVGVAAENPQAIYERIKMWSAIRLYQKLAESSSMNMTTTFRPMVFLNRPIKNEPKQRIGLTTTITHNLVINQVCSTTINMKHIRRLDSTGQYATLSGDKNSPMPYRKFFTHASDLKSNMTKSNTPGDKKK